MDNTNKKLRIGVLALQGAFAEHIHLLKRIEDVEAAIEIRTPKQLEEENLDGLIIPGGESTAMSLVAERTGLLEPLRNFTQRKPTWGTCAGMILLSNHAEGTKKGGQELLGGLDVVVQRNRFGSQTNSFEEDIDVKVLGGPSFRGVFIRAPVISQIKSDLVQVLARLPSERGDGSVVAVRQGHLLATAFHPELTADDRLHRYFLSMIRGATEKPTERA